MNTLIDYKKIANIPRIEDNILILDFNEVDFLNTFEIIEFFTYLIFFKFEGADYEIQNKTEVVSYLYRVNFFERLEKIKKLIPHNSQNPYEGKNNHLLKIQTYNFRQELLGNSEKIIEMFLQRKLSEEMSYNLLASLSEVVDNAFFHNLGLWDINVNGRCFCLIQDYPNTNKIFVSIADTGVGFQQTLQRNYPQIKTEEDAIKIAIQKETTARNPQKGGNGLILLQNNVFNGFKGKLFIRSQDTLMKIEKTKTKLINKCLPFSRGSCVHFILHFS
jgi:hypothetical protein